MIPGDEGDQLCETNGGSLVTLSELAELIGKDRSNTRKIAVSICSRLRIETHRIRPAGGRGQQALAWDRGDVDRILRDITDRGYALPTLQENPGYRPIKLTHGVFYVIQLVPELSQGRIKLGYASSISVRLADHRTACPTAITLGTWPCKMVWEAAAIDSITRDVCTSISSEVFDCTNVKLLLSRAQEFFALMPPP